MSTLYYRNLAATTISFPAGITSIYGENGAGKTNLLEAVYLALTGHVEVTRLQHLIQENQTEAYIRADLHHGGSLSIHEIGLTRTRRQFKIDGVKARGSDISAANAVLFRPEDSELVFGSPSLRRQYLDSLLSRLSLLYAQQLNRYERAVTQRNAALKNGEWISVWDEALIETGTQLLRLRRRALPRLNEIMAETNSKLGSRKQLTLRLQETTTPETYASDLQNRRSEELARGMTTIGPHRDDLLLMLDQFPANEFASRGEGRTIALALRQAEISLLTERFSEEPLLLIDDFSAELDPLRRGYLLDLAAAAPQALVTGTEAVPAALQLRAIGGRLIE